jgi:hypothetical protein
LVSFIVATSGVGGVIPGVHDPTVTYTYDGITISMTGSNTVITMDGQSYGVNWEIFMVNGSSELPEAMHVVSMYIVNDTYQNSAIMVLRNSQVQVAEIFSFSSGSVDANMAVQNLLNTTAVYFAVYDMSTNHQSHAYTYGTSTGSYSFPASISSINAIPGNSWGFGDQYATVSWRNDMSLYAGGIMESTQSKDIISVPFGPVTLPSNATYSIDPTITPSVNNPSYGITDPIPLSCIGGPCGGGGGGGGGGSGGTPPGTPILFSNSVVSNDLAVQPSITVTAREPSIGSGAVSFYLYGQSDVDGSWHQLTSVYDGSSTGNLTFTWYGNTGTVYYWDAVKVYASNSYGGSYSSSVNINFTAVGRSGEIYDSSGNPVGYIVNGVGLRTPVVQFGNGDGTALNTVFVPSSSSTYGVNSVSQVVSFYSGNNSNLANPNFQVYDQNSVTGYFQNYQNSEAGVYSESLSALSVVIAFAALAPPAAPLLGSVSIAIGVLALIEAASSGTTFTLTKDTSANDYFSYNVSAGSQTSDPYLCGRVGGSYCDLAYNTLGVRYGLFDINFQASYIFNVNLSSYYNVPYSSDIGGTYSSPGYLGTLSYTTNYVIVGSPDTNVYYGSNTMYYTMAGDA